MTPSHSLKNTFKYLMENINSFTEEYGWNSGTFTNIGWSFHTNLRVLFFTAVKNGANYRYRVGISMTQSSIKANTVAIEQLFTSETYWEKSQIIINTTGCFHRRLSHS